MIRWGMIGCGAVTEVKSAPALQRCEGSSLVAVTARTAARVEDFARRHGVPRWHTEARAVIEAPDIDAIYIATPPSTHCDYALQCAAAGKPVYVEKPMARTHAECRQMIAACEAAGVPLFVAYYRRALPSFTRMRELIEAGAIGEVRAVRMRLSQPLLDGDRDPATRSWRVQPAIAGGGRFVDLGSHMLDYLDFLLGPLTVAHAVVRNLAGAYSAEDTVSAHFSLGNGAVAQGLWCFCSHERIDSTEIIGHRGALSFAHFADTPPRLRTAAGEQTIDIPWPRHVQQPLVQRLVDALHGRGECPSTGVSAARTNAVMDEVLAHRVDAPTAAPSAGV